MVEIGVHFIEVIAKNYNRGITFWTTLYLSFKCIASL